MYQVLVNAITSNFDIKHKTYKPFPINIEKKNGCGSCYGHRHCLHNAQRSVPANQIAKIIFDYR